MLGWKGNDFPKEKARHLYVVFDDWAWGYSIRKIDLTDNGDSDLDYHLPPPIFRFQAPRGSPNYFAGAFNSKILAMQPMDSQFSLNPTAGVPVFDVRKRSLMVGPRSDQLHPIYIPIGGRLFALAAGSFQLLYPPSDAKDFVCTWHTLPDPPFEHKHVASYAVHRDGRTMIVSTSGSPTIFSFDTAESVRDASAWKQNGQGQLPFNGRGFFVSELGALVGLNRRPDTRELCICSIDVTSEEWYNVQDVKFCNVDISVPDFVMGTTLVSMGGNKFCVMQCCMERNCLSRYMRLITFSVMYDQNGGLTIGDSCRCRTYINFPKDVEREPVQLLLATMTCMQNLNFSPDGRFIANADRDLKIQVTLFPKNPLKGAHEIQSFCLGHTDFVSCIAFTSMSENQSFLISGGGDSTVRLWDYINGCILDTCQVRDKMGELLEQNETDDSSLAVADICPSNDGKLVAVAIQSFNGVMLLACDLVGKKLSFLKVITMEKSYIPTSLASSFSSELLWTIMGASNMHNQASTQLLTRLRIIPCFEKDQISSDNGPDILEDSEVPHGEKLLLALQGSLDIAKQEEVLALVLAALKVSMHKMLMKKHYSEERREQRKRGRNDKKIKN